MPHDFMIFANGNVDLCNKSDCLVKKMKKEDLDPDEVSLFLDTGWVDDTESCGTLVRVYLRLSIQKGALRTFSTMRESGEVPNGYMCRILICAREDAMCVQEKSDF